MSALVSLGVFHQSVLLFSATLLSIRFNFFFLGVLNMLVKFLLHASTGLGSAGHGARLLSWEGALGSQDNVSLQVSLPFSSKNMGIWGMGTTSHMLREPFSAIWVPTFSMERVMHSKSMLPLYDCPFYSLSAATFPLRLLAGLAHL